MDKKLTWSISLFCLSQFHFILIAFRKYIPLPIAEPFGRDSLLVHLFPFELALFIWAVVLLYKCERGNSVKIGLGVIYLGAGMLLLLFSLIAIFILLAGPSRGY